jgi:hypothetical protein
MATVREHLSDVHSTMAKQHTTMAASHAHLAKCFSGMAKASGGDDGEMYKSMADEHGKMCKTHTDAAAYHTECAQECAKAHADSLNKTVPDGFSSIAPSDVPFGIRSVPRAGQPELSKGAGVVDASSVPLEFRHLITDVR